MNNSERLSTHDVSRSGRGLTGPPASRGFAVPRLSAPFTWATTSPEPAVELPPAFSPGEIAAFIALVLGPSEEAAQGYVSVLLARGTTVETIYLELLTPTARQLGDLWSDDSCDFVDVTVALGRLQRLLREMSALFVAHQTHAVVGRILLSCIPGEQHTLGLFMVSEFFVREGWEVSLGAPVSDYDLGDLLRHEWFDVVGFSVACNSRLSYLTREIPRLRKQSQNRRVAVLVGGRVFSDQPELVGRVHADGSASDASSAPALALRLIGDAPRAPLARRP